MRDARYTATAYHEAGHAIVGLILGDELIEVCVTDQNTGHCITTPTYFNISVQDLDLSPSFRTMTTMWVDLPLHD